MIVKNISFFASLIWISLRSRYVRRKVSNKLTGNLRKNKTQLHIKVRNKTYRFEAEKICKNEKSALASTSEPEFLENIDNIWWEGSIWDR